MWIPIPTSFHIFSTFSSTDLRTANIFLVSFAACTLVLRYVVLLKSESWRGSFPPGPRGWPLVGYALYLGRYPHKVMTELGQTYGDVFSLTIGPRTVVVVNGVEAVKEALVRHGHQTSGRTPPPRAVAVDTSLGYFWSSGHLWRTQRRLGRKVLRHLSDSSQGSLQEGIQREAAVLCAEIAQRAVDNRTPIDISALMNNAVANVMCSVVFGTRFDYDDAAFRRIMELSFDIQKGGFSAMENFSPFLYKLPFLFRHAKGKKREIRNFIRDMLYRSRARESTDPAHAQRMADIYFTEMDCQCLKKGDRSADIIFTEVHVVSAAWDMFIAGVETTAVTLAWAVLFLTLHADVQKRIQAEIDHVVGQKRTPSWADHSTMPFTRAAIMEIQRCANIVPLAVPHTVTEEFQLKGYTIPKGTILFINLWSVLSDPKLWDQPEEFRPERFLDGDLQVVKPEAFMPFSAGPRVCMGEQLARVELFLFITNILQRFDLILSEDEPHPSLEPLPGITCGPHPYRVCVSNRLASPPDQD